MNARADFLFQAASVLRSFNVISLEKSVTDDELITMLHGLDAPAPAGLAADVIEVVGPAGAYLGETHTRRHVRDFDRATFLIREASERRRSRGEADVRAAAVREVTPRLEAYEPPDELDQVVRRQLDEYCLG